jgi:hypothetical protein
VEGGGQEKRDGSHGPKPREHPYKRPDQDSDEAEKEVVSLKRNPKAE